MLQTTSNNSICMRRSFTSCATSFLRGWFIAIGYQIPFEGGHRWQQWLTEIRPLADTRPGALPGFPNAVSLEFNCHTFAPKNSFYGIDIKPSSTRARTGDLSRVKRT